ncbi:MAG: hypothetical protein JXB23_15560 [Candidatus Aminicenantes bacterium]|nr:hypothetical protein [Candidatus Aminicenantes bacterium]
MKEKAATDPLWASTYSEALILPFVDINMSDPSLMGLPFFRKAVVLKLRCCRGQSVGYGLRINGKGTLSTVVHKAKLMLDTGLAANALTAISKYSV